MGIFKKDEVYDYTLLQKKGFLKVKEQPKSAGKVTKDGYVELDFGEAAIEKPQEASEVPASPLGFFDNFSAGTGETVSPLANFDAVGNIVNSGGADLKELGIKLEDFEYKLARIADKLAMIESKIEDFEKKVL